MVCIFLSIVIGLFFMEVPSLRCPVVAHWGCLAGSQQDEVLKAIREKDREDLIQQRDSLTTEGLAQKRSGLDVDQITEFICG